MSFNYRISVASVMGAASLCLACGATMAPPELLAARGAYSQATTSRARDLAPVELDKARLALNEAEESFREDGDDRITRDLSYIAERRSLAAIANGNVASAEAQTAAAREEQGHQRADLQRETSQELTETRQELATQQQRTATGDRALAQEQQARTEAERTAAAALESLRRVAQVQEESRGIVITLSGSVLFATNQSVLLPIAQQRLQEVATMLVDHRDQNIVVEGHTDSRGSNTNNMALSLARAQSVRDFLVSKGVPMDRIRAEGLGSSRPIGENTLAEGRANNRRVEIVVQPKAASAVTASN